MTRKQFIISTFIIILLANAAFGFAGMGGGNTSTTPVPQDLNSATESDHDIIIAQHLIEYDAVQLQSENKVFIRETLIFRNIGTKDFYGPIRTWLPDGSEKIKVSKSETMTGGGLIPLDFEKNGNIISWKQYVEQNSKSPSLYDVEYTVAMKQSASSITGTYSKKLAYPTLINYRYIEKPDLPALVIKITKPQGSSVKFVDENGNKIVVTELDEKGEIFRFSSPKFNEINIDLSTIEITSTSTPTITADTPTQNSQLEQEVKELKERLNKTEERQSQQETRISWLESMVNSILGWIKSFF